MTTDCHLDDQCERIIAQLDCELQWGLGAERQRQYSAALLALTSPACSGERLRTTILNYHSDHARLDALRDTAHPQHSPAWEQLQADIAAVMQKRQLAWSSDWAVDREDLLQIACIAVAESLQRFRFESRFTTWVVRVAVWSVQRAVCDRLAQKRFAYIKPLDSGEDAELVLEDHPGG